MAFTLDTRTGPVINSDGPGNQALRQGRTAALITADGHGRYYEQAARKNLFRAHAIVTAPVIYTTAAGTGGPLLWNPATSPVNAVLLAATFALSTVATTTAVGLGITGNSGQTSAPTSTTALDSSGNCYFGGASPVSQVYRVGTPTNAGNFLLPLVTVHLGANTVDTIIPGWMDLGGCLIVPPGCWASIAATATMTAAVLSMGLLWEEVPI